MTRVIVVDDVSPDPDSISIAAAVSIRTKALYGEFSTGEEG